MTIAFTIALVFVALINGPLSAIATCIAIALGARCFRCAHQNFMRGLRAAIKERQARTAGIGAGA